MCGARMQRISSGAAAKMLEGGTLLEGMESLPGCCGSPGCGSDPDRRENLGGVKRLGEEGKRRTPSNDDKGCSVCVASARRFSHGRNRMRISGYGLPRDARHDAALVKAALSKECRVWTDDPLVGQLQENGLQHALEEVVNGTKRKHYSHPSACVMSRSVRPQRGTTKSPSIPGG